MTTPTAADRELDRRMAAWAAHEDESRHAPMPADEVAEVLPDLLRLADAFPPAPKRRSFPPIAGGPAAYRSS